MWLNGNKYNILDNPSNTQGEQLNLQLIGDAVNSIIVTYIKARIRDALYKSMFYFLTHLHMYIYKFVMRTESLWVGRIGGKSQCCVNCVNL